MKFPIGFTAGGPIAVSIGYADGGGSSTNPNNTYNFTSQNLGSAPAAGHTRTMVILIWSQNSNLVADTTGVTGVTIAGVTATRKAIFPATSSVEHWTCWIADMPSGSSGTVSITRSSGNGFSHAHWEMWALYDLLDVDPIDSDLSTFADPSVATLAVEAKGAVVAIAAYSNTGAFTWTGPTEDDDQIVGVSGTQRISGASQLTAAANASYTASANGAANSNTLAVSFR